MNDATDYEYLDLSGPENGVNLAAVLPEPTRHLGGEPLPPPRLPGEVEGASLRLRIGRRPIALDLRAVYDAVDRPVPEEYAARRRRHKLCLVILSVGVLNEGSYESLRRLGLRVQFPDDPRIRIFDMFPRPELVTLFEGGLTFRADLRMDGQAEPPGASEPGKSFRLEPGPILNATAAGWVAGRLSFAVYSRVVDAVGVGDFQGQWVLRRQDKPLHGKDLLFGLVVSAPKDSDALALQASVYAVVTNLSTLFTFPVRLEQKNWTDLAVEIQKKL